MTTVAGDRDGWADAAPANPTRRRRVIAIGAAVVVLVAGGFAVVQFTGGATPSHPATTAQTSTATVTRTDLAQTTPVSGTVGYASPASIVQPAGTAPAAVTQAQQAVAMAAANVAADQAATADGHTSDAQSVSQGQQQLATAEAALTSDTTQLQTDQATLAAAQQKESTDCQGSAAAATGSGSPGSGASSPCATDAGQVATDQQKVAADQQKVTGDQGAVQNAQAGVAGAQSKATQGADQNKAKMAADTLALANAQAALATAQSAIATYGQTSKYTALPVVGQVVKPGQPLWSVDGNPVPLLTGAVAAWRPFTVGMADGPDVAQLDRALVDLGFGNGLTPATAFTAATAAAISRLQASLGLPQTGALALGSVIFEPSAVRVTAVHPLVGAPVQGGGPVIDVSSTTPIVNIALPVDRTYLVKVGDAVTVTLPDGTTSNGTVTAVGTVATAASPSGSGNGNSAPTATVSVTVSLANASPAGTLDQAPVSVNITNSSAHATLAVPVGALLALAGGGYAVEVVAPDGTHHLVGVTTGIFDDQAGLVQVDGAGLAEGQKVVVAA